VDEILGGFHHFPRWPFPAASRRLSRDSKPIGEGFQNLSGLRMDAFAVSGVGSF
jgi:hypothetical protein